MKGWKLRLAVILAAVAAMTIAVTLYMLFWWSLAAIAMLNGGI